MGLKQRVFPALLLTFGLTTALIGRAYAVEGSAEIAGIPVVGAAGVSETLEEIMQRMAILEESGALETSVETDMEKELAQPDRTGLPQNPSSPDVSQYPELPEGYRPSVEDITPFSPQTVGTNFTSATLAGVNPTLSFPPDCMGAIGPTQFVTFVNGRLVTFSKTLGMADGVLNADPDVFFASVMSPVGGNYTSDPRIRYDRLTGRWFLIIIDVVTPNRILFAVSDAASAGVISPSTVFTFFFLNIATTPPAIAGTCFADYPTLGIDANALYIGTNNFCGSPTQTFNSTDGYVVRKSSIMGAGPIIVTVFRGLVATSASAGPYTPQGVDNFNPSSNEGYFIGVDNATFGTLMMRRVATPGGTPTISGNISITTASTSFPITVNHLGNTGGASGRLSALDDRLFAAHIRNGRLWTAQNIGVTNTGATSGTLTRNATRWYELNVPVTSGTPTITQSGTLFTATGTNTTTERHYWIPSVMVSGQGHAALGFSTAGSNERANSATVGRLSGDALGTLQTPVLYTASSTAYNPPSDPGGGGGRRWGDYSYTSLDPLDDMTMWTVQMFCDVANSYGVRVAKLIAPPPATPSSIPDVTAGLNPVNVTLTGAVVSGSGFYDPGTNLPGVPAFSHLSVSIINGGATGTPPTVTSATYVNPTTVNLVLNAAAATANIAAEKYTVVVTNPDGQSTQAAVLRVIGGTPTVSINPTGPSLAEGNAGTTPFNFTVNLSATTPNPVTVFYNTSDSTATTADGDYAGATSSIIIPANTPSGTITVNVNGDLKHESNEVFKVTLTSAVNATLVEPKTATATIVNDDAVPTMSIDDTAAQNEGDAGTTVFGFNVTLSNPSAFLVTANAAAANGTATILDGDYESTMGTVSFSPGDVAETFNVEANGDTKYENDETFLVNLTAASNCMFGDSTAVATILNDDDPPTVSVDDVAQAETNAGTTPFQFTVSLSEASGLPASVDFVTSDGTATLANNDYVPDTLLVSFPPGTTSVPVVIDVNGDVTLESDEIFNVTLQNLTGATAGDVAGTGTIQNDDNAPVLDITNVSQSEGTGGTTNFAFEVTLSNPTDGVVTVEYQTNEGSATLADNDYISTSGLLTFPAKTTGPDTIIVSVTPDSCGEPDEDFTVTLFNASGAIVGTGTGNATIENDDDASVPTITVDDPNGGETLTIGTLANILWTASDNVAVTGIDILLSRNGGATFPEVLALGIPNSGSFAWLVTGPPTLPLDAFIRIVAHDDACNAAEDVSDAGFEIADPTSGVSPIGAITEFRLGLIHPNPTSGATTVDFDLPREASVRVTVIDLQGREVATLVDGTLPAGRHEANWNARTDRGPAAMGVYFIHYEGGGKSITRRLVLSR